MLRSAPASPFEWNATERARIDGVGPVDCFLERELTHPVVTVAVGSAELWVTGPQVVRVTHFPHGFPGWRAGYSALGNRSQAAIGADGSVVFQAGDRLYVWRLESGQIDFVADDAGELEALAISPAARRVATLHRSGDWLARVWSISDGAPLATLHWNNLYPGSLSCFDFSADGDGLGLELDVAAQSGSDFTENHGWKIGAGPEQPISKPRL